MRNVTSMRRAPFPSVHHSFMVRVLAPLKRQAHQRHMPLQQFLRQGLEAVMHQGNRRAERESWQRALAILGHNAGMPEPVAREFGREVGS